MSDPHWSVRESAEIALLNFGKDVVEPLIKSLDSKLWTTRFRAARLLGEIGDPRAIPVAREGTDRHREQKDVTTISRPLSGSCAGRIGLEHNHRPGR